MGKKEINIKNNIKVMHDYQIFYTQAHGGVSRYHIELVKALRKKGINAMIPIVFSRNKYLESSYNKPVCNEKIYENVMRRMMIKIVNIFYTYFCILFGKYDIIHMTWVSSYLSPFKNVIKIVTIHDMVHEIFWSEKEECRKEIKRKRDAIYYADAIIAVSNNTKKDILKFYPEVPENKIHVIHHGTNHLPLPQALDVPSKYVLYVGRRGGYKGSDILLDGIKTLMDMDDSLFLVFVGGGGFDHEETSKIERYGISGRCIQMTVSDAELAYIYQNAKCFVYPSEYEGFGFPILEAFDNHCPVICADSSCLPEVGGDAALYFDNKNAESLTEVLEKVLYDTNIRETYIERGNKRVEDFTWEKSAEETLEVYREVLIGR